MKLVLLLAFCFLSGIFSTAGAAVPASGTSLYASPPELRSFAPKRNLLRLRTPLVLRHFSRFEQDSVHSDAPSKLAKTSLWMLLGSYVGIMVLGNIALPLAYIGLAGILAANVLAIVVLARKSNKKSKKYARLVLLITGLMMLSVLLILGFIYLLFPGAL